MHLPYPNLELSVDNIHSFVSLLFEDVALTMHNTMLYSCWKVLPSARMMKIVYVLPQYMENSVVICGFDTSIIFVHKF